MSGEQKAAAPTLAAVRASVGREVGLRRNVYKRRVAAGKMTQATADREIACMAEAYAILRRLEHGDENLERIARAECAAALMQDAEASADTLMQQVDQLWRDYLVTAMAARFIVVHADLPGFLEVVAAARKRHDAALEVMHGLGLRDQLGKADDDAG